MNIMVIDRDSLTGQLVKNKLEHLGHDVTIEPAKNKALDIIIDNKFEVILFDPAPLSSPVPFILSLRKSLNSAILPYIALLSREADQDFAISAGTNDSMGKPLDIGEVERKLQNAERLTTIIERLNDDENFGGGGRVLSKLAFSQLFMSALDRAGRYGEQAFFIFIKIDNYDELHTLLGEDEAGSTIENLQTFLSSLRRQSDVLARSDKTEFCLMLQRPRYESEPFDAARRFKNALTEYKKSIADPSKQPNLKLMMIDVPAGTLHFNRKV